MIRSLAFAAAAGFLLAAMPAQAQIANVNWRTIDGGGETSTAEGFVLTATIAQADAGVLSGVGYTISGGFWPGPAAPTCYANCDGSAAVPILNVNDFVCFQQRFVAGDPYANCDGSTSQPVLNVNDFVCFQTRFAAGCS